MALDNVCPVDALDAVNDCGGGGEGDGDDDDDDDGADYSCTNGNTNCSEHAA